MLKFGFVLILCLSAMTVFAQVTSTPKDSAIAKLNNGENKSKKQAYPIPRVAATRSALLPGLGQAYNKSYWKIPIVYAGLGITGGILISNINLYKDINYALDVLNNKDTANFNNVDEALRPLLLSPFGKNTLVNYRAETRRNIDYSVLAVLVIWGLNVVDATVDAHLKSFDVSSELSLQIKPNLAPTIPGGMGLGIVLDIHKAKPTLRTK